MKTLRIVFVDPTIKGVDKRCTSVDVDRNSRYLSVYDGDRHVGSWPLRHVLVWRVVND